MIVFVLLLAALILLILAAVGVSGRINTLAAGLACWVAAEVVTHWPG